jgi:hypothetical protein
MSLIGRLISRALIAAVVLGISTIPAQAQGKSKHTAYVVTHERALRVSRMVLVHQGYTVVRVQRAGPTHVIYYRRGNMGRGKGKGPMQRMVIRTVRDRVLFEETDPSVLIDIDVKLKL